MPTKTDRLNSNQEFVLGKVYALEDRTIIELFNEYRAAFTRMKASLDVVFDRFVADDIWTTEEASFRLRTETLMTQLVAEMNALTQISANITLDATEEAWRAGSTGLAWSVDDVLSLSAAAIPLLPAEAIRAQIIAPYEGSTFIDRFNDNRVEFELRIRRSLIQSQIEGEGIRKVQERLAAELGISTGPSAGGRTHTANFNRLQVLARTEIIRASALGSVATFRQNEDVLRGWEWLTAEDERVCPICAPLDGRIFDLNGNTLDGKGGASHSVPPAHPQCRCSLAPALQDVELEQRIVGKRKPFLQWAAERGLTENVYGQAYNFRGKPAPLLKREAA